MFRIITKARLLRLLGRATSTELATLALQEPQFYARANGLQPIAKAKLTTVWDYLVSQGLKPDDMIVFRQGYQPSATAFRTIMGMTAATSGTPTIDQYGWITNGTSQYGYLDGFDALSAYTLIFDIEGYDSGQPTTSAAIWSLSNATGINNGGGHSSQLLTGGEKPVAFFSRNSAGSAIYTTAYTDNGDNLEVAGYMGDPQVIMYSSDGAASPTLKMGVNGIVCVTDSTGNYIGGPMTRLTIGAQNSNNATHFNLFYKAQYGAMFLYRRVLTEAEFLTVTKAAHMLDPRNIVFAVQGDSNSSKRTDSAKAAENWPGQLIQQNSAKRSVVRLVNHAQNGTQSDVAATNYATRIGTYKPDGRTYTTGIYAQMYGTNDIAFTARTAAQIYANRKTACDLAKADGFVTIQMTVIATLTKGIFTAFDGTQETKRNDLNNLVAAGVGVDFDYLVDLRNVTALQEPVGAFYLDGYHPNVEGYKLIAEEVATVPIPGLTLPFSTARPTISGTGTLTCTTGTWSNTPTSYAYQWYVVTPGASGTVSAIGGATSATYDASSQTGNRVFCRVTATNASGSQARSANLTATL